MKRVFIAALLSFATTAALALPAGATDVVAVDDALARLGATVRSALAYEHGEGVARDAQKAAELYCEAARLGHIEAQFNLGWMYANGRGIARDDSAAAHFFSLAAHQGHAQAERMLRFVGKPSAEQPECLREKPPAAMAEADSWEEIYGSLPPERRRIAELVRRLAPDYAVDPRLALAVITVESNFEAKARSNKNAQGLMQLIPETAERFNVKNSYDPVQNIKGGLAYLRWLLSYFRGDVALVAAGYNAGEGAVDRYRGVPPYQETRLYVKKILGFFRRDSHPFDENLVLPSPVVAAMVKAKL